VYGTEKDFEGFPLFQRLDAVREGRVIYMDVDGDFANALGFSSPLSIPFALEQAVPQLAAAVKEAE
jgi:iron complex transport system substrate-binding protein